MKYLPLLIALLATTGCTKVLVYGKDHPAAATIEKKFSAPAKETFESGKKALDMLGYKIDDSDEAKGSIRSGWMSTKSNSHYLDLFERKDYGTTGAYYRVEISIEEEGGKSVVTISTPVRSLVNHVISSGREERRVLNKMADLLRREDFEMTNVGVQE